MAFERKSADQRLKQNNVVETARREAAAVTGVAVPTDNDFEFAGRGRFKVRIADLVSNPYNPRTFYNPASIDSLAKSFGEVGQIEAIKLTTLEQFPGKHVIVDGERRVRAAKARGDDHIDAEISEIHGDDALVAEHPEQHLAAKDLYLRAYRANKDRDEQTIFDDALMWKKLLEDGVFLDHNELGAAVGVAPNHVTKVTGIASLPELFFNKLAQSEKPLGLSHAYNLKAIWERAGEEVAEHWLQEFVDGRVAVRKLEEVAKSLLEAKPAKARRPHYQSRVKFRTPSGAEIGELKVFGDGRTELSLKGVQGADHNKLADRVKAVIEEWTLEIEDESTAQS